MEIKIFGKKLFEMTSGKARAEALLFDAVKSTKKSAVLPDFMKFGRNEGMSWDYTEAGITEIVKAVNNKPKEVEQPKEKLTPKGVYELKLLHDESFKMNTEANYVEEQIADFKEKLEMMKAEDFDVHRGTDEISSILIRMENRKNYGKFAKFYENYPYTVPSRIDKLLSEQKHLKLDHVAQFMADMPKDATQTMKEYNKQTQELCGKKAVFYIIADKKDFEKTSSRRDPILLAQSPFGHFWQILGAWDKEMLFLEQL